MKLPTPKTKTIMSLEQVIENRRTVRSFSHRHLPVFHEPILIMPVGFKA